MIKETKYGPRLTLRTNKFPKKPPKRKNKVPNEKLTNNENKIQQTENSAENLPSINKAAIKNTCKKIRKRRFSSFSSNDASSEYSFEEYSEDLWKTQKSYPSLCAIIIRHYKG